MEVKKTILVIDDEPHITLGLKDALEFEGFRVVTASNGKDGALLARQEHPHAILLDLMLPDINGYQVCEDVRRFDAFVPIIMLTAKSQEADKIRGLDAGADDYVTKPFSSRELLARINAVIRRTQMLPPNLQVSEAGRQLAFGEWRLDTTARHLLDAQDTAYPLSGAEFRLLRVFLDHANRVLSRDQLLSLTQGRDAELFDRSIDLLVSRVRQRLGDDAREPTYIKTVRSEGYVFSVPVQLLGPDE